MTDALRPLVERLSYTDTEYTFFTALSGPKSINNEDDAAESANHCLPVLRDMLGSHDGFLVACYSQHPLVPMLKEEEIIKKSKKHVTGILEASVGFSLLAIAPNEAFGIVSTGKIWEELLPKAVGAFLNAGERGHGLERFGGVETTGLDAVELHDASPEEVKAKMTQATKRLIGARSIGAICLGCAGMAGLDKIVREACIEELGIERGSKVAIVDGVQAGIGFLEAALRAEL
ncbi:MAG: hypothetical protein M1820_006463 [Bogoriella megaspora]|nr:MAG: hypothetical protein M1820_006463 [Bogoriella megaspora]